MADNNKAGFKSAGGDFSIPAGGKKLDPKALIGSMTKDVKQRWMMVGGVGVVAMAAMATWMSTPAQKAPRAEPPAAVVDTTPKGLSTQKDWKSQTGAEMIAMQKTLQEQAATQKELLARMEAMRLEMSQTKANPAPGGAPNAQPGSGFGLNLPPPPEPPKSLQAPKAPDVSMAGEKPTAVETLPAAPVKRSPARSFSPESSAEEAAARQRETVTEEYVSNDRVGYLPAGSFADATLISGVEAFTGGTAQSQPQPVVLRLNENAVLPNAAQYQIKGCHILMSMWGDMSSERVFGRASTLTCVDAQNKLVLSEEVEGVVVDADGKNGVRGTLQDRQGAKLARSLLAGFAQGMASAFGAAQSTVTSGPFGAVSSISGANALHSAGYNGANSAAQSLAQFYLKQAEATMPVISIDAGRKVSVLFTKSKPLRYEPVGAYKQRLQQSIKVEREVM